MESNGTRGEERTWTPSEGRVGQDRRGQVTFVHLVLLVLSRKQGISW